jgi:hypothetical protein
LQTLYLLISSLDERVLSFLKYEIFIIEYLKLFLVNFIIIVIYE